MHATESQQSFSSAFGILQFKLCSLPSPHLLLLLLILLFLLFPYVGVWYIKQHLLVCLISSGVSIHNQAINPGANVTVVTVKPTKRSPSLKLTY